MSNSKCHTRNVVIHQKFIYILLYTQAARPASVVYGLWEKLNFAVP